MPEGLTLSQIGEQDLIRRLAAYARPDQWNDDAALLPEISPERWVISSDTLVEGVHFSAGTTPASAAGWRAAAANLSDLAAMGCLRCEGITVALSAPGDTEVHWIEQAYGGMQELLQHHGGHLLGGDCSGGEQLVLAITAVGPVCPDQQIQRGAGKTGDWLISTGAHGRSALGLQLLLGGATWALSLPSEQQQTAIRCHQRPQPRFDAVAALHASRPVGQPWRVGGTDSSDGLRRSLELLGGASGCRPELNRNALPDPSDPCWSLCLDGGEDFELVLALEPSWAEALLRQLPGSQHLGQLGEVAGQPCWADSKNPLPEGRGFEHFS
tara:strand:- start:508 stop:1485 length:978 start_codon:yes stop_codon:yes gene_type:complete